MQRTTLLRCLTTMSAAVLALVSLSIEANAETFIGPTTNDGSFETPVLMGSSYAYSPTGTPWTFSGASGASGISTNSGGAFAVFGAIPNGSQYAFLQVGSPGSTSTISQSINISTITNLAISFSIAGRSNGGGAAAFSAALDGNVFDSTSTSSGEVFTLQSFNLSSIGAGSHMLTFTATGLAGVGTDNTALLDNVNVSGSGLSAPEPGTLALLATACPFVIGIVYRRVRF